ncbi:insect stage-specific antigen [Trypanosoma conorhini]|uniref:Insect stage-specific antigen n=1 Tax=Trypanosoma conorhini TaxID=83891 RepID=A0A3R7NTF0_9TRYP|nr:insect stage-specific antigen [Trypanosoma conorhini]RNF07388.1 insect stage-specific antigen [Trypanosoma conorhini]
MQSGRPATVASVTRVVSARRAWPPTLLSALLLLLLLLTVVWAARPAEAQAPSPSPAPPTPWAAYSFFSSLACPPCSQGQTDGPSGVGTLFTAAGGSLGPDGHSLLLCDVGGGGSSVRIVNRSGIFTVAGSRTDRGMSNGPVAQALFNTPTSVVYENGALYVADSANNAIRRVAGGMVSSFFSAGLQNPSYILPYRRPVGAHDLFVSDTGHYRIIFTPLQNHTFFTEFVTGFQPGVLQISVSRRRMFAIRNALKIVAIDMDAANVSDSSWDVGNSSCTGYLSSLMLTADESELFYYGNRDGTAYIFSVPATASKDKAPSLCPQVVMEWTGGAVTSLVLVNQHEFYVVTTSDVYLVRDGAYTPTPTPTPPQTPTVTPTAPLSPTIPQTPTPSITVSPYRGDVVAAFPAASLPLANEHLMAELYAWMMKDVGIAFNSTDFLAVFPPKGKFDVPGDVNVSTWTNLTTQLNFDGTIAITEYYTPHGMSSEEGQDRLFASPWYWTRKFLDSLKQEAPWTHLEDFCVLNCVEQCATMTFDRSQCLDYVKPPACNDVCVGAVVSSAVLGATGVALFALMIGSPANALSAVLLVPPV